MALAAAVLAGILGLVVAALSIAQWSRWLIESSARDGSGPNVSIVARQGLVLSEALVTIAFTFVAVWLLQFWSARNRAGLPTIDTHRMAGLAVAVRLCVSGGLLISGWQSGWYYHLQHAGPVCLLALSGAQAVGFAIAALPPRARPAR